MCPLWFSSVLWIGIVQAQTPPEGYARLEVRTPTQGKSIAIDAFINAVMDGDHYPLTASYMGVPALVESRTLARLKDGSTIVYQRTGAMAMVKARQYINHYTVTQRTETLAEVQWQLVQHVMNAAGQYTGPYADVLNQHLEDAVFTPYNKGMWRYDQQAQSIDYAITSDPGGSLPCWTMTEQTIMLIPRALMQANWGI